MRVGQSFTKPFSISKNFDVKAEKDVHVGITFRYVLTLDPTNIQLSVWFTFPPMSPLVRHLLFPGGKPMFMDC